MHQPVFYNPGGILLSEIQKIFPTYPEFFHRRVSRCRALAPNVSYTWTGAAHACSANGLRVHAAQTYQSRLRKPHCQEKTQTLANSIREETNRFAGGGAYRHGGSEALRGVVESRGKVPVCHVDAVIHGQPQRDYEKDDAHGIDEGSLEVHEANKLQNCARDVDEPVCRSMLLMLWIVKKVAHPFRGFLPLCMLQDGDLVSGGQNALLEVFGPQKGIDHRGFATIELSNDH